MLPQMPTWLLPLNSVFVLLSASNYLADNFSLGCGFLGLD